MSLHPSAAVLSQSCAVQVMLNRVGATRGSRQPEHPPGQLRYACGYVAVLGVALWLIPVYLGHREVRHAAPHIQSASRRFEVLWDD
jgi:hypothetical protein